MAYKLSLKQKNLLIAIHVLFAMAWFGATLSLLLLLLSMNNADNGEQIFYTLANMDIIDKNLLRYSGLAVLISGMMLSAWTQWGLVKYYWIVIKLVLTIGIILFAILFVNDVNEATNAFLILVAIFNSTALAVMTFMTYFKPFGKIKKV